MSEALATKYRPRTLEEMCGQSSIIKILKRQVELRIFKNCYLFCGGSGTGKTTAGRAFARLINNGQGEPIEIDAASNNGVDNVRELINVANERALDAEYKVIIVDEAHALTNQAWQAFLKCIEEPPAYTIFIFCTTDPQKIPSTILNRVQRFNFTRLKINEIKSRLKYICDQERFFNYDEALDYISKLADGGMRDAIALLDKCSGYSNDLNIQNVLYALGNYSYETMFDLTKAIITKREDIIIQIIEDIHNDGNDLKLFIDQYLKFIFDIKKYATFKDLSILQIPQSFEPELSYCINFDKAGDYYSWLVDKIFDIKNTIKLDTSVKTTVEIMLIQAERGV